MDRLFHPDIRPEKQALILGDTKEGTMAIRVVETLCMETHDEKLRHLSTGRIINSEGITGKAAWGKRAKWCAYPGDVEETCPDCHFDHPENRDITWWMARHYGLFAANPFGQSYLKKPRQQWRFPDSGRRIRHLRYRFLFQSTVFDADAVEQAYRAFAASDSSWF